MILDVPFYKNDGDGNQCMQVAMKSALKYFLDQDFELEELDRLTGREANFWTYTPQIVSALFEIGLQVKFFSRVNLESFLEGEAFFRSHYGPDAEKILAFTDAPKVVAATKTLLQYDLFEKKALKLGQIEEFIKKGYLPMVLIDHNKIAGQPGSYQGHFVVVTGFDSDCIYYHESGPKGATPNKKVSKMTFREAFNANGTDNDCVVVFNGVNS